MNVTFVFIIIFTSSVSKVPVPKYKEANVILFLACLHFSNKVL